MKIFQSSAHHYKLIGTRLGVSVADLLQLPDMINNNLICVFERWIDRNIDVTWREIKQLCVDFPEELGKAKAELEKFMSSEDARKNYSS